MPDWYTSALADRQNPAASLAFAKAFLAAPAPEQAQVGSSWDPKLQWALPSPWRLACADEAPGTPAERIRTGLLFQALAFAVGDVRDALVAFAIYHNSAQLAGLDPKQLFEEVARAVGAKAAQALRDFANRDPADQSLQAFLLKAVPNPAGGWEVRTNW